MKETNAIQQQTVREYLLGGLPGDQQTQFEERLLMDDEFYEELVIVEDELVDEYLGNKLSAADRERFESHFVTAPEHQERLNFARTFRKYVTTSGQSQQQEALAAAASNKAQTADVRAPETPAIRSPGDKGWFGLFPMRNPVLGYAMGAVLVFVLVGAGWVVWQRAFTPRDPGRVLSVALRPGLSRGDNEASNRLVVQPGTDTIRLQLLLPENRFSSYQATLLGNDGRELVPQSNVRSEVLNGQRTAVFDIPAEVLPAGEYRAKLDGVDEQGNRGTVATYSFRVQTRSA